MELQKAIDSEGTIDAYNNGGGQSGTKQNPDIATCNQYAKLSNDITKMLIDLVPAKAKKSKLAAFTE